MLNKNIPVPLYFQLKQQLIEKMDNKDWRTGDPIPSERELSEKHGISRMTVRQAMNELVNEGRLIREKGKGTFVAKPKINQGLYRLTSFTEDMAKRGMTPSAYIVDVSVRQPSATIAQGLDIGEASRILMLTRVRLADDRPMALETTHLPLDRLPGLDNEQFEGKSLYGILQTKYGVEPHAATQIIEVGMPTPREVQLLDMKPNHPVMLIERVTRDVQGVPFEYVKSVYPGDRYKFYADLLRDAQEK